MFANREWQDVGVLPINEQTTYKQPGNSHSSRHASLELLYGEKTGDRSREEAAIRRLNWATYMVDENGRNMYPAVTRANASRAGAGAGHWLTDGYGDYARHYLRAMASLPSLAPENQNHLLRTYLRDPQHRLHRRRDPLRKIRRRVHRTAEARRVGAPKRHRRQDAVGSEDEGADGTVDRQHRRHQPEVIYQCVSEPSGRK